MRKRIEKTFLWMNMDKELSVALSWITVIIVVAASVIIFAKGADDANDPSLCRVRSIGYTLASLPYAIGCNLFKDRYDLKVNP